MAYINEVVVKPVRPLFILDEVEGVCGQDEPYEHHNQAQDCYRCDHPWLRSGATSSRFGLTLAEQEFDGFFDRR